MKAKIPYILLIVFALSLLSGIFLGEVSVVIRKAIFICLECIGMG